MPPTARCPRTPSLAGTWRAKRARPQGDATSSHATDFTDLRHHRQRDRVQADSKLRCVSVASTAWRRIGAWCIDWLIICVYAAALFPLGLLLVASSIQLPLAGWNALSFVLLVVPTTAWMAAWETGSRAASPGKRLLRLRVAADSLPTLGRRRALVRNGLKIALPWELGHTAAFNLAGPQATHTAQLIGMASGVAACVVAFVYVGSLFIGSGRSPYDRASGTRVATSIR
jgi:uncharacterized RDD family membrane protein YckC